MPWVPLDDEFPEHPKNDALSDLAFRLKVAGICYSNRHLTDGLIPADKVPRLVPRFKRSALNELLNASHWTYHESIATYEIHDYLQWNKSRAQIEEESERQRKRARKRWEK